ncbi:MAG: cytochrome c biogenesis protein CcsA [Acidobacteriota bacterium]|nr:MAG: cytochrome c biogenesis protein CcsA [Acidobacteriota bacterium]
MNKDACFLFAPWTSRALRAAGIVSAVGFVFLGWVIALTPLELKMGVIQKIFYIHLPSAWCAFLGFFLAACASVLYLVKRRPVFDALAVSAAEVGVAFTTVVLLTGSAWGRAAWGVWWTWDVRLTTTLILWFIYVGYLMLRSAFAGQERQAALAAVYAIVGFLDVPVVYMCVNFIETQHPKVLRSSGGGGLAPEMVQTLLLGSVVFLVFFVFLWLLRARAECLERRAGALSALAEQK